MSVTDTYWNLPDPVTQSGFYDGVVGKRFFAFIIDSLIIGLIAAIIVPFTAFVALLFVGFLTFVISLIYRSVTLANRSATLGMRLMGIEFRTHDGQRLDGKLAIFHTLILHASLAAGLPQLISVVLMLFSPRGQGLGDMVLGTVAINRSALR